MKPRLSPIATLALTVLIACGGAAPAPRQPTPTPTPTAAGPACNEGQATISREADTRAAPYGIGQHLEKNFPDGRVSWLMKDADYDRFIVKPAAKKWGRCNETGCYLFAAPTAVIHGAVTASTKDGRHDPAVLGKALGLPAASFEGTLRMMTLEFGKAGACVRLPVDADPGVWKCKTPEDTDCFKFGGYTSGGIAEIIVIDAPVEGTTIEEVP